MAGTREGLDLRANPSVKITRPGTNRRLATAARVLRRFDLQALMLAAQTTDVKIARTFIATGLAAGRLAGPELYRRKNVDGWVWTVTGKGASA